MRFTKFARYSLYAVATLLILLTAWEGAISVNGHQEFTQQALNADLFRLLNAVLAFLVGYAVKDDEMRR